MINHNIDLDFSTSDIKRTVVKQDSNKTHQLIIKLYDNNDEIELNANWQYTISCRKADNSFIVNSNNISISSNSIYVELTKQMLSCPGTEKCELLIQNGNQTLYSSTFYIYVEKNVNYGSVLESTNEYNSLSDTLNQIKEYEKESKETKEHIQEISDDIDATYEELADAVDATNDLIEKNTVIEANEATRKTNETIRETNEQKRQTDTATAIKNANDAADNANSKANDLQNKLDSHHFVLTEDKDVAGGVAGLDNNLKVSNNKLYEASTNEKGITQLDDSVTSNSSSKAATSKAVKIAYDKAVSVSQDLQTHNSSSSAHDDIRTLISNLTTRLNTLADSDDTTLDQLSEIVAYIKSNKNLIDGITTSKVNVSDIIDNLTSTATNKPLSAKQGKILKGLITDLTTLVENKVDKVSGKGLSTNDYTTTEKNKLSEIASGAEVNVQSDWDVTDATSDAFIKNKPIIPTKISQLVNDGTIAQKVNTQSGISGKYGYVNIVHIEIKRSYVNYPIIFEITGRTWTYSRKLYVCFQNSSEIDPELNCFLIDNEAPYDVAIVKSDTSTWDIYMQKSESYGTCVLCSMYKTTSLDGTIDITFPDKQSDNMPDGAITPTVITWDKASNSDTLDGYHANQFVHRENPICDGNLNCRKNIWFDGESASKLMIEFLESGDANGYGISIGGGGMTVIGGGESAYEIVEYYTNNRTAKNGGAEKMIIGNDTLIEFLTNCQSGYNNAKHITMNTDGTITAEGFNGKSITSPLESVTYLAGNQGKAIINSTAAGTCYNMLARMKSPNGVWTLGSYQGSFSLYYTSDEIIAAGANGFTKSVALMREDGSSSFAFADYTAEYEEGTWTPTIGYTGSSNYSLSNGKYIKIGKIVHCIADVTGKAIANENLYVATNSLPFVINKYIHGVLTTNHGTQPVELYHVAVASSLTTVKSISFAANLPLYVAFSYTIN